MICCAPKGLPLYRSDILNVASNGYIIHVAPEEVRKKLDLMEYDIVVAFNAKHHFCPTRIVSQEIKAKGPAVWQQVTLPILRYI